MSKARGPLPKHHITLWHLVFMTSALFMTMLNMPLMAQTGTKILFFNVAVVLCYILPISLISAELATGWPKHGVYSWVEEAFGTPFGFMAIFLQWFQSILAVVATVAYTTAALIFAFDRPLESNPWIMFAGVVIIYWGATLANFRGTRVTKRIAGTCLLAGTLLPSFTMIVLGLLYVSGPSQPVIDINLTKEELLPSFTQPATLYLFLSFLFGFIGMEGSATHATEVRDVRRTYPLALFIAALIGFSSSFLGGLTIAMIIPEKEILNTLGVLQTYRVLLDYYGLPSVLPIAALLIAVGAAGQASTWIAAPVLALAQAGRDGMLPPVLHRLNTFKMPVRLMLIQATIATLIALAFLIHRNTNEVFLYLTSTAVMLYSVMYVMLYSTAIRLRYKRPNVPRAYKVPFGNYGIWILGSIGILTSLTAFILGFSPPDEPDLTAKSFRSLIVPGVLITLCVPFILWKLRRPSWKARIPSKKPHPTP
ncbi:Glutamate/gamma-aminobutyrate antiporter [Pseudovibrio axinellae]|uniref:Glutamate/gamma-aminobutyrate antiporter n=1 Tax=Pseudovibrio axinellae TaxID=989403 RepID=A0A166A509_9HYPH|nr:APC family permease [Pseudovibrio axinellae]KZL20630.1 Glutamate/gamma-aminobutyrate antiporter [Pseudovibrio axinellae]SER27408.1 Amino acid transporter [Pseudovibrio axinellae]